MKRSEIAYVSLLSVIFLVLLSAMVLRADHDFGRRPWNAFDLVLIPEQFALDTVHSKLDAAGREPLSAQNAVARIEDFNGQQPVSVRTLTTRFDEADPRLDPFVRSVQRLFVTGTPTERYHVIYLRRNGSILEQYNRLHTALGAVSFQLAGWNPVYSIIATIATLLILGSVVGFTTRRYFVGFAIVFVSSLYVGANGPGSFVRGVLTGLGVLYFLRLSRGIEREWLIHRGRPKFDDDLSRALRFLVFAVLASVVSFSFDHTERPRDAIFSYLLYLLAGIVVYLIALALQLVRIRLSEHRLFSPYPILREPWRRPRRATEVFPGIVPTVIAFCIALTMQHMYERFAPVASGMYIPVPNHRIDETERPNDIESAERLLTVTGRIDGENSPLSTAGFIAHRSYQTSLMYGGTYRVPSVGSTVQLRRFRRDDERLVAWRDERVRFDGEWLLSQYDVSNQSVYRIFTDEGGIFTVVWEPAFVTNVSPNASFAMFLLMILTVVPGMIRIRLPYRAGIGTVAVASRSEQNHI